MYTVDYRDQIINPIMFYFHILCRSFTHDHEFGLTLESLQHSCNLNMNNLLSLFQSPIFSTLTTSGSPTCTCAHTCTYICVCVCKVHTGTYLCICMCTCVLCTLLYLYYISNGSPPDESANASNTSLYGCSYTQGHSFEQKPMYPDTGGSCPLWFSR